MTKYVFTIVFLFFLTSAFYYTNFLIAEPELSETKEFAETILLEKKTNTRVLYDSTKIPEEIVTPSTVGEVYFPHQMHFEDLEIDCEQCHHEMNASKFDIPHEEYFDSFYIDCKACHDDEDTKEMVAHACSNCHHKKPINIADEMISKKVAVHQNCWECHDSGKSVEASESCEFCHSREKKSIGINVN